MGSDSACAEAIEVDQGAGSDDRIARADSARSTLDGLAHACPN